MSSRTLYEDFPHSMLSTHPPFSTSGRWSRPFSSDTNSWSSALSSLWAKHTGSSTSSSPSARGVELNLKLLCWERGEKLLSISADLSVVMDLCVSVCACMKISKKIQSLQLHLRFFQASNERRRSFTFFSTLCEQCCVTPPTMHYANNTHNMQALWYSSEVPLKWATVSHLMTWLHGPDLLYIL